MFDTNTLAHSVVSAGTFLTGRGRVDAAEAEGLSCWEVGRSASEGAPKTIPVRCLFDDRDIFEQLEKRSREMPINI